MIYTWTNPENIKKSVSIRSAGSKRQMLKRIINKAKKKMKEAKDERTKRMWAEFANEFNDMLLNL